MPPNSITSTSGLNRVDTAEQCGSKQTGVLFEHDADTIDGALAHDITPLKKAEKRKLQLVWRNIILFAVLHIFASYGCYLFFAKAQWPTVFFAIALHILGLWGVTAGVHRLWAHRSYKAKWPVRLILIIFNTIAFQESVFVWARDHRVHHKFSETDADPHNATRGFFFAHVGWLLCKRHPDVFAKGKTLDLSDLYADPFVMFQKNHFGKGVLLLCFILPTIIPMYFWSESFVNAFFVCAMFRWSVLLHMTWSVNSFAHIVGTRPYDKSISPADNRILSAVSLGEGWHNYHHVFPWDYKTGEWGNNRLDCITPFVNFFAKIGWAYDLKTVSPQIIEKRVRRTGDGSHAVWGFGDRDLTAEDHQDIMTLNKIKYSKTGSRKPNN